MKKAKLWILALLLSVAAVGCSAKDVSDAVLGKDQATLDKELDTNGDGIITREEILASGHDENQDGNLDAAEVAKATAPNTFVQIGMGILAGFFPVAGVAYTRIKRDRRHIRAIVGGIEDMVGSATDTDGFTKADLYAALAKSAALRTDAVKLGRLVKDVKTELRAARAGGTAATK